MSYSSEVLADSPLAYWRMGETSGTTLVDSSGNGRGGTYVGSPALGASGLITDADASADFDGVNDTATIPHGSWMNVPGALTLECWIRLDTIATTQRPIMRFASGSGAYALTTLSDGTLHFTLYNQIGGASDAINAPAGTIAAGNTYHVVATYDGATMREFINGTQVASKSSSGSIANPTAPIHLGSERGVQHWLNGRIDEVAIYGTALSPTRIAAHYTAGIATPAPSVTLSATRPARTAAFTATTVAGASLSAARPARTAAFVAATVAAATLTATSPARVAAFEVTAVPASRVVTLAAERPARTAEFTLSADASLALSATRALRSAVFSVAVDTGAAVAPVVLSAERPSRTATFTVQTGTPGAPGLTTFAATRPQREATFVGRATIPIVPVPAHLRQHGPAPVVIARALGPATMTGPHGTQPTYSVSSVYTQRARQQIVADGVDITFLRGVRTPDVTYTLLSPLRYGPGQLDLPQVVGGLEPLGDDRASDLAWMWEGAPVEVNLVLDDPADINPPTLLMEGVYKGVLVAWDLDGKNVSIELGGEANGRASLRNREAVIFPRVNDLGHQISDAVKDLGLPVYPPLGNDTGIEMMTAGGVGHLEHIQNLCAQAWTRQGKYWTIMPNAGGAYEVRRKSDTMRHATVFFDDARTVAKLRRDISEEPNRIFITGVTPQGKRVRFGVYPGLVQGPAPDFPGHMQAGDTGEGVRLLTRKLQQATYLKLQDVQGGYDDDVVEAVKDLQGDAGLPKTGEVNQKTWDALYDLNTTGLSLIGAHIEPAAQDPRVRKFNRSANGTIIEFNDAYDPTVLPVDRTIDAGVGKTRSQLREFARTILEAASSPNWVGDITFHTGALLRGEQSADVIVTPEMVMESRELIPTMNLWEPRFEGGTQFNISALQINDAGLVTATVDTRFRDALEVWDIIDRNRESRNDPARRRNMAARSSTIRKDSLGEWDEIGGLLGVDIHLERGWNRFPMPGVAAEGTIRKLRIALKNPAEFAVAVFGRKPDLSWLNEHIPHPLTVTGTKAWDKYDDELVSDYWMLFSAGTHAEPCGYWPGRKVYKSVTGREPNPDYDPATDPDSAEYVEVTTTEASGTLTGKHVDAAGFSYFSDDRTAVWVTVWAGKPNTIEADRLLWPQLEAGA